MNVPHRLRQETRAERAESWFAAKFHCEQVLKSRPVDATAKTLLDRAKAEWDKQKAAAELKTP